jgi:threonine dehydrogenase-like Zn-dependent dehydrogenase
MRAAVMRGTRLVVDTVADPEPGAGEVLVRSLACGICGSDLHALKYGSELAQSMREVGTPRVLDTSRDVVMGHEFCAEVLDYGPHTTHRLKTGTPVCSVPFVPRSGGNEMVGFSNDLPGGFGELMVLADALVLEVPNGLPPRHAALTEPLAVGVHAVAKANLGPHDVPLVIGCGPVGLAVIAALKVRGAAPIVASDFSPTRRKLAERMGADVIVDPAAASPYASWQEVAAAAAPDQAAPPGPLVQTDRWLRPAVVFECVGIPGILDQILRGARSHARIVVVGVCMQSDVFTPMFALGKELNLQFVFCYTPQEYADTLRAIAEGDVDVRPLVTGQVGIAGVPGAFEELASPERHAKIIVDAASTADTTTVVGTGAG